MSEERTTTAGELAKLLGGKLSGDQARVVRTTGRLDEVGPEALSWVGSPDLLPEAEESKAGVLLIPEGCTPPPGRTVIEVADPDVAMCEAVTFLAPPPEKVPQGIYPTAFIGEGAVVEGAAIGPNVFVGAGATIGPGTQLHPGVYVGSNTRVGRDCVLWPNVVIRERVTIGDRVIVHPNATIGADGFGYLQRDGVNRKIPQVGTVIIEDDVEIGANSTVDRARNGVTRIGRGTKIDNLVMIAHNCDIGEHCVLAAEVGIAGSSKLGHHVAIGGQGGAIDHVNIGNSVQITACSVAFKDFPDGAILRGVPATEIERFRREQVWVRRLPEWMPRLRELIKRLDHLESQVAGGEKTE
ncbi:MAG: UDP-3-O-(3-hydroxymyristoyl)glucosamine N-acyltransferase [Phycisphaerales bacterium]|nr:MAG: UDP-3-O-(3-hydroxymyristoyl)glucosamine N-acyltransferase [Phycisphaerales bacterium]